MLLAALLPIGVSARTQRRRLVPPPPPAAVAPRRMLDLPPKWIDRVQQMTPEQQERFLSNNDRFRNLPPQRQEQIRRQLQTWNNLTPEQRQAVLERQQVWERMTPDQQRYVRESLLPQWQSLAPRRRQVILQKLHDLRGLDDSARGAKLDDEVFVSDLNPNERQLLRDLSNLRVAGPEPPGL
jgi:hypothetical protein